MPAVTDLARKTPEPLVGKKRKTDASPEELRQVNIRFTGEFYQRIEETADALGLDVAQLLRMVIRENISSYELRAEDVRRKEGKKSEG